MAKASTIPQCSLFCFGVFMWAWWNDLIFSR